MYYSCLLNISGYFTDKTHNESSSKKYFYTTFLFYVEK